MSHVSYVDMRPFALSAASLVAGRGLAAALQPRSVWPEECEPPGQTGPRNGRENVDVLGF